MRVVVRVMVKASIALLLLLSVVLQVASVPVIGAVTAGQDGIAAMRGAGVVWWILFVAAGQSVLVFTWRLTSLAADDRIFERPTLHLVRGIVVAGVAGTILVVVAFVALNVVGITPPLLMYGLIGSAFLGVAFTLVLSVMDELLRRSGQMYDQLSEVI